jgi:hypothetical protein
MPFGEPVQGFPGNELLRDLPLELDTWERCLAMVFILRKPSSPCQIKNLNLPGPRGALHSIVERADIEADMPRSEESVWHHHAILEG